jgi:hypothetical protein
MLDDWAGRRAYPRIDVNLPIRFGLIDVRRGKRPRARYLGETMDISYKGLGIRMNCHALRMIPIAIDMMGDNKKYDLEIGIELGGDKVRAIGEVKWSLLEIPNLLKMGIFIKGMGLEEEGKWAKFIEGQYRESPQKTGPTLRLIESIQMASNHLDKASDKIFQQMKAHEVSQGSK